MLSGIQMIYQNEVGRKLSKTTNEEGRCRICGGDLLGETVISRKHLSGSWTDENVIADPNSQLLCEACAWMTRGKGDDGVRSQNKATIWHGKPCMIVEENRTRTVEYYEFYEILKNRDFTFPVLLAVHGKYKEAVQKHIEWKSNRSISSSPKYMRVAMSGMYVFDTGNRSMIDGVAQFDLDEWLPFADHLAAKVQTGILPYLSEKFSDRTKAHILITEILNALSVSGQLNEASYLAAYLVGYSFFPVKEAEKGETNG